MANPNKMYTILKNSYNDDGTIFISNLFFANTSSHDTIRVWFSKIINADDVKKVWVSQKDNDTNIFYVEYTQSFEKNFYHGFSIQQLDFATSKQDIISRMTDEIEWKAITKIADELIQEKNKK